MTTIWLVIKHDVGAILRQRSFWVLTMIMPLLLMGINAYVTAQDNTPVSTEAISSFSETQPPPLPTVGLVDKAALIVQIPPDIPPDLFVRLPDETAAQTALANNEIDQYIVIPADYQTAGTIAVYDTGFQILSDGASNDLVFSGENGWIIPYLINANLTDNVQLATVLRNPTPGASTMFHRLRPPAPASNNQALASVVASVTPYVYYFLLIMGGSYMMRSVVAEKENRTVEILLLSLPPRQLMVGKILAMSVIVLIQLVVWVGGGVLILDRAASMMQLAAFTFPPGFFIWATLFLILGYLLFAAVMTAVGAIATNTREGGQAIWLLIIPQLPTLMFGQLFLEDPNNPLVIGLTLFPFSAPSAMVTRLAVGDVPIWQLMVSIVGLVVTTYLFIILAGRFFKSGNLISDTPFSWRRLATGWRR